MSCIDCLEFLLFVLVILGFMTIVLSCLVVLTPGARRQGQPDKEGDVLDPPGIYSDKVAKGSLKRVLSISSPARPKTIKSAKKSSKSTLTLTRHPRCTNSLIYVL